MSTISLQDTPLPSPTLISLLSSPQHLPYAHPLLRRLQFTSRSGGTTPWTHVLFATYASHDDGPFAAAYVDVSRGPETEMWIFSSLESALALARLHRPHEEDEEGDDDDDDDDEEAAITLVLALFQRVKKLVAEYDAQQQQQQQQQQGRYYGRSVMVGSMADSVRDRLLLLRGGVSMPYHNPHDKWLFRIADLPGDDGDLGDVERKLSLLSETEGAERKLRWDTVRREDLALVISRTDIPKAESTLGNLPSVCIREADSGILAGWAFLHMDGTLSTLHVEERFRGRGMAKLLAVRLVREHNGIFISTAGVGGGGGGGGGGVGVGGDDWCAADVHVDNRRSQGVCRSIGGKIGWGMSWSKVDLDTVGDAR